MQRRELTNEFKAPAPAAIAHLVNGAVLQQLDGNLLAPRLLAFHCCADEKALAYAKRSVAIVLNVLREFYEASTDQLNLEQMAGRARKMYNLIEPEGAISLGLFLGQEFGAFGRCAGTAMEITAVRISESIITLEGGDLDGAWDAYVLRMSEYLERRALSDAEEAIVMGQKTENVKRSGEALLVLISHSSRDAELAQALINLLRSGLGLVPRQIRCSSVDGYRLPAGVNTDAQLRREIKSVKVLIGLLTPNSLSSAYVLLELGARWLNELFMIPLLAGIEPEQMPGPHRAFNALSCTTDE